MHPENGGTICASPLHTGIVSTPFNEDLLDQILMNQESIPQVIICTPEKAEEMGIDPMFRRYVKEDGYIYCLVDVQKKGLFVEGKMPIRFPEYDHDANLVAVSDPRHPNDQLSDLRLGKKKHSR